MRCRPSLAAAAAGLVVGAVALGGPGTALAAGPAVPAPAAPPSASYVVSVGRTAATPARPRVEPGRSVAFRNDSGVPVVLGYGPGWPGAPSEPLAAGSTSAPRVLTRPGSYGVRADDPARLGLVRVATTVVVERPAAAARRVPAGRRPVARTGARRSPAAAPAGGGRSAAAPTGGRGGGAPPALTGRGRPARTPGAAARAVRAPVVRGSVVPGAVVPGAAALPGASRGPVGPAAVPPLVPTGGPAASNGAAGGPPAPDPAGPAVTGSGPPRTLSQGSPGRSRGLPVAVAAVVLAGLLASQLRLLRARRRTRAG